MILSLTSMSRVACRPKSPSSYSAISTASTSTPPSLNQDRNSAKCFWRFGHGSAWPEYKQGKRWYMFKLVVTRWFQAYYKTPWFQAYHELPGLQPYKPTCTSTKILSLPCEFKRIVLGFKLTMLWCDDPLHDIVEEDVFIPVCSSTGSWFAASLKQEKVGEEYVRR